MVAPTPSTACALKYDSAVVGAQLHHETFEVALLPRARTRMGARANVNVGRDRRRRARASPQLQARMLGVTLIYPGSGPARREKLSALSPDECCRSQSRVNVHDAVAVPGSGVSARSVARVCGVHEIARICREGGAEVLAAPPVLRYPACIDESFVRCPRMGPCSSRQSGLTVDLAHGKVTHLGPGRAGRPSAQGLLAPSTTWSVSPGGEGCCLACLVIEGRMKGLTTCKIMAPSPRP